MRIPTAQEKKDENSQAEALKRARAVDLANLAEEFVKTDVADALVAAKGSCVNVNLPFGAYRDFDMFLLFCRDILFPLGYAVEISHDGAGYNNTLLVSW